MMQYKRAVDDVVWYARNRSQWASRTHHESWGLGKDHGEAFRAMAARAKTGGPLTAFDPAVTRRERPTLAMRAAAGRHAKTLTEMYRGRFPDL
jgi:hypothetical protein